MSALNSSPTETLNVSAAYSATLDTPAGWDVVYRDHLCVPRLKISLEGDSVVWEQVKERAAEQGLDPEKLLRLALYSYLDPTTAGARLSEYCARQQAEVTPHQLRCEPAPSLRRA